jgi:hypothetical protein
MHRGTPRGGRGKGGKGRGYGVGAEHQANAILIEADESSDKESKTIYSTENVTNLSHSAPDTHSRWILDSGASQHVTGRYSSFSSYTPYLYRHKEIIQTADGACHSIKGVGVVQYTPSIKLPSVLYVRCQRACSVVAKSSGRHLSGPEFNPRWGANFTLG